MSNKLGVSLVKYLCPICGNEADEGIIMNSLLTEKNAKAVEELHGKAVGFAEHPCKECSKYKNDAVFFIGIDAKKSKPNNPYRTGKLTGVKKDSDLVKHLSKYILELKDHTKYCFIEDDAGKQIGLW